MSGSKFRADVQAVRDELSKAEYALNVRRYDLAIELLQKMLREYPENSAVFYTLARVYVRKEAWKDAEHFVREALRLDPQSSMTQTLYGNILLNMRRIDEAEAAYQTSLALQPHSASTHYVYALLLLENRLDLVRAREHAIQALELDPAEGPHHMALAKICATSGDFSAADVEFSRALSLDPENVLVRRIYGWYLLYKRNQPALALEQLRYAMQLNPEDKRTRRLYAMALKATQKYYWPIWNYSHWWYRSREAWKMSSKQNAGQSAGMVGWLRRSTPFWLVMILIVVLLGLPGSISPVYSLIFRGLELVFIAFCAWMMIYDAILNWRIKRGKLK